MAGRKKYLLAARDAVYKGSKSSAEKGTPVTPIIQHKERNVCVHVNQF
jgi:hypothetical protein